MGQVETITDALGLQEHYSYDQKGQLTEKLDKEGYLTRYGYTGQGDVSRIQYADGREVKYSYNPLRHLQEMVDWLGITKIATDPLGRARNVQYPDGKTVSYTYGKAGERTSITYPDGRIVYYGFDEQVRLSELRDGDAVITYDYDKTGRLAEKHFPGGLHTNYRYDSKGQIQELTHKDREGILDRYSYQYDWLGNKTIITKERRGLDEDSGIYQYGYDALGRLDEVVKNGIPLRIYEYDVFGNRTHLTDRGNTTTYTYNAMNQLITRADAEVEETYTYDKRGNLSQITANGQLKNQYMYGALNRLEWAVNEKGEAARYQYNGLGHRVGKEIGKFPNPLDGIPNQSGSLDPVSWLENQALNSKKQIHYTINLTREYHNLLQKEEGNHKQTFLWDGNVVVMLDNTRDSQQYYMQDELGSPIRLMDEERGLKDTYGYDEFGQDIYHNQGATQPFGYTGYQKDSVAGTYFAQAREYLPNLGYFGGKDKNKYIKRFNIRTINQYVYCVSNPIKFLDPMGLDLEEHYTSEHEKNDPIQIDIKGNTINIDAYVDINGDVDTSIGNTTTGQLVREGIEAWGGDYEGVFGHDVTVHVNIHEGHKPWYWWLPWVSNQNYLKINLQDGSGRAGNVHSVPWDKGNPGYIDMYTHMSDGSERAAYDYRNTITHEFGHVLGLDDGYPDDQFSSDDSLRPLADMLLENDIMVNNHHRNAEISVIDIQMMVLAAATGEWQFYMAYLENGQSLGVETYGTCEND